MTEFVDTNILLYANGINALREPAKVLAASQFLKSKWNDVFITWQALMEFGANVCKKSSLPLKERQMLIRGYAALLDHDDPNHPDQIELAMRLMEENKLSYWDANMIASVAAQGGTVLYSEDFANGVTYAGVTIRNPFLAKAD